MGRDLGKTHDDWPGSIGGAFKLAESGEFNEALAMIDQVIASDPNNWRSYFRKSAVLSPAKRGRRGSQTDRHEYQSRTPKQRFRWSASGTLREQSAKLRRARSL